MLIIVLAARTIIGACLLLISNILINRYSFKYTDTYIKYLILILIGGEIINYRDDILIYIIPIIIVLFLRELLIIIYNDKKKIRNLFEKDPVLLIKNSKVIYKNLLSTDYKLEKLLELLRKKNIYKLDDIKYCFLEDDKIYVVLYDDINIENNVIPVIIDNKINKQYLNKINIDEKTIKRMLDKENIKLKDVFYGVYKNKKLYIITNSILK